MKILSFCLLFIILIGCNQNKSSQEEMSNRKNQQVGLIEKDSSIKNEIQTLSEIDAYNLAIKYLLDRGAGKSCLNSIPKENIKIENHNKLFISSESNNEYSKEKLKTEKLFIYWVTTRECNSGGTYNRTWGLIQNGNSGEVFKELTSDPAIVDAWLSHQVNLIQGNSSNIENEQSENSSSSEIEKTKLNSKSKMKVTSPTNIEMVPVGDFAIGKYEITQEQWQSVMGYNPSRFKGGDTTYLNPLLPWSLDPLIPV